MDTWPIKVKTGVQSKFGASVQEKEKNKLGKQLHDGAGTHETLDNVSKSTTENVLHCEPMTVKM
jgi:hypothetical protein